MPAAPPRPDEAASLAALHALDILDTAPEPAFDALVAAAAQVCDVPISLVSLLDKQRQWFKAAVGLDGTRETSREVSFCAHVVLGEDVLEVDDARKDPRFADNPLVAGDDGIRFYAGVPLCLSSGPRIGVLCVVDRRPRQLDERQRAILASLGIAAVRLIEGRSALRDATEARRLAQAEERRFRTLSEEAPFGVFQADGAGRYTYTNPPWRAIYGLDADAALGEAWKAAIHVVDREHVLDEWRRTTALGCTFESSFRIVRSDRSVREVRLRARPLKDGAERVVGHVGSVEDVTVQRQTQAFLERAGRLASVGGWEVDLRTRALTWSDETRRIHEVDAAQPPSLQEALRHYSPEGRATLDAAVSAAIEHGAAWDLELPFVTARGLERWVRITGDVVRANGVAVRLIGALQDVTDQRRDRDELSREQTRRLQTEDQARATADLLRQREEMLDLLAHEVRQPLNNASAALQDASAVLAELGEGVASNRLVRAQAVMGQVLSSIDNNLAVATLLTRSEAIHLMDTDIHTLVAVTCADLALDDRPRVQVVYATPTRTALMDMSLMRLALRNLLANALRYSPAGSPVELRVSDQEEPPALVFDVSDRGGGIAPEVLPQLFMRGRRKPAPPGRALQSMGLGLYIVRRVMELHGGRVFLARNGPRGVTMQLVVDQGSDA
jgi:PAS domain S-box-containing protein